MENVNNITSEMLFIPANVASSKNGRTFNMKLKRSLDSKSTQKYKANSKEAYIDLAVPFKELLEGHSKPYFIGFHLVRDSRRKYDFINPLQTIQDLMVQNGWLDDDNTKEMYPVPLPIDGRWETLNPKEPGVYLTILNGQNLTFL